jgi:hypothetical protein
MVSVDPQVITNDTSEFDVIFDDQYVGHAVLYQGTIDGTGVFFIKPPSRMALT